RQSRPLAGIRRRRRRPPPGPVPRTAWGRWWWPPRALVQGEGRRRGSTTGFATADASGVPLGNCGSRGVGAAFRDVDLAAADRSLRGRCLFPPHGKRAAAPGQGKTPAAWPAPKSVTVREQAATGRHARACRDVTLLPARGTGAVALMVDFGGVRRNRIC